MTFKFSLTVSDNLQIFGFFLLKSVSRAKNSVWTSGVNDFYPQCFVALGLRPLATNCISGKNHQLHSLGT
jgi:hypothetical protein